MQVLLLWKLIVMPLRQAGLLQVYSVIEHFKIDTITRFLGLKYQISDHKFQIIL